MLSILSSNLDSENVLVFLKDLYIGKGAWKGYFTKQTLANAMSFLIKKCFFPIANMVFKQDIGVPMGMIFGNLFLYFFESKYIKQAVSNGSSKAYKYRVSRFTDDLCTINDGN